MSSSSATVSAGAPATVSDAERQQLAAANVPLVGYLVSELIGRVPAHVSREELTSAGLLALVQASRSFDPSTGVPFTRFASMRIRGALIDELRDQDWASRGARSRVRRLADAEEVLTSQLGRPPTESELAGALGVSRREVHGVRSEAQRSVVLSLHGHTPEGQAVHERVSSHVPGPEETLLVNERMGYLTVAVAALPERLREVVEAYFFDEMPMAVIAARLGVTESRVSQLRSEALRLLRDGINTHLAPEQVRAPAGGGVAQRRREAYFAAIGAHSDFRARLSLGAAVQAASASVPVARTA